MDEVGLGPVGYLVVEFPGAKVSGEGLSELVALTDRGIIRILDLAFVMKQPDGSVTALELRDIDGDGDLDLMVFEGAASNLLDQDDLNDAGQALNTGSAAAVLLYENTWAGPFVRALKRNDAELVAAGFIPVDQLSEALDLAETRS